SGTNPTTLGPGEPLTATLTVTLYFSLVLALPLILFELYGFVLPAFSPGERRTVLPLLVCVPFLFATGVAFGYLVVLPAAVHFLQNFNSSEFNVMVQANQYYKFAATVLLAMGLSFQAPIAIVGSVRLGLVTPRQLRRNRRYAILACAAVAAFLPGDAFTLMLETIPLYLLYEVSILIASVVARRDAARAAATGAGRPPGDPPSSTGATGTPAPPKPPPGDARGGQQMPAAKTTDAKPTTAEEMIDHIDPDLAGCFCSWSAFLRLGSAPVAVVAAVPSKPSSGAKKTPPPPATANRSRKPKSALASIPTKRQRGRRWPKPASTTPTGANSTTKKSSSSRRRARNS